MLDFSNKVFTTKSDDESERLLNMAITQGYSFSKGLRAMIGCRTFKFTGLPYKVVTALENVIETDAISFSEQFGDEWRELNEIIESATRFCRAYGYQTLRVYADENENNYSGNAVARMANGLSMRANTELAKPRKVTLEEIAERFGCPIEIVS